MKILVIGSGGREHALCWKIAQSKMVEKIYCAPGNGGTREIAENIDIQVNEIDKLLDFAINNKIDLTVVGPEDPLVNGIVDIFQENGLMIFGPNKLCAKLEGSKEFSKVFMEKYNIPTAKYQSFINYEDAVKALDDFTYPLVIKADGLCLGKGVIICNTKEEAINALKEILVDRIFGGEGEKVVIEEYLDGIEASLLCFVTEGKIIPLESAKDYKKIYENDLGPNTGGVGCISPNPIFTNELSSIIKEDVLDKISYGLTQEKMDFKGILFIGFMIADGKPKVLEFNVRFGDPETQVLIPRLKSDIVELFLKVIDGSIDKRDINWSKDSCITVVLTSNGYPKEYKKDFNIDIKNLDNSIILFHNGTKYKSGKLLTNGGRVLSVTNAGKDLQSAREAVYDNIGNIQFEGLCYRKDIGLI
ncbi:phosphoribosylamine--glycine ligase [Paratissierella segnis]|jgi:phosphoribosylamine--glycine ligase|uniref:Phosphoribosylamine--glycine ligase n=1 Tax=Paratissierella segnis TaxID=2763679 RepID=A0A926EVJ0_9FIRM|nr:phosphoribosylamine--glycine ligase [Paratissierella segnis]MBC8589073.1 phosphoribosylamine--glycine ligase [Paratissierella segnis]